MPAALAAEMGGVDSFSSAASVSGRRLCCNLPRLSATWLLRARGAMKRERVCLSGARKHGTCQCDIRAEPTCRCSSAVAQLARAAVAFQNACGDAVSSELDAASSATMSARCDVARIVQMAAASLRGAPENSRSARARRTAICALTTAAASRAALTAVTIQAQRGGVAETATGTLMTSFRATPRSTSIDTPSLSPSSTGRLSKP